MRGGRAVDDDNRKRAATRSTILGGAVGSCYFEPEKFQTRHLLRLLSTREVSNSTLIEGQFNLFIVGGSLFCGDLLG